MAISAAVRDPAPRRSAGGHAGGGSRGTPRSSEMTGRHVQRSLGQWRVGVGDGHAPDPILPERQGKPGELPLEPGAAGGLWREQRELLTGRRAVPSSSRASRATAAGGGVRSSRANRRRSIASASAVGSGKRCSTSSSAGCPRPGEREIQVEMQSRPRRPPARAPRAARSGPRRVDGGRSGAARDPRPRARSGGARTETLGGPARAGTARAPRHAPGRGSVRPPRRNGRPARSGELRDRPRSGAGRSGSAGHGHRDPG